MGAEVGNQVVVQIEARNIAWVGYRDPETGRWIGVCHSLNLNAAGDTFAELQASANEAMALLFEDLAAEGDLDQFLSRNGWTLKTPMPAAGTRVRFDVPADWNSHAGYDELLAAAR